MQDWEEHEAAEFQTEAEAEGPVSFDAGGGMVHGIIKRLREMRFKNAFTCMYCVWCVLHHECISVKS